MTSTQSFNILQLISMPAGLAHPCFCITQQKAWVITPSLAPLGLLVDPPS